MTKTFTQNDAVRFIYGELDEKENENFLRAMLVDSTLRNEVRELRQIHKSLDTVAMVPSQKVIDNILDYSKSLNLHS